MKTLIFTVLFFSSSLALSVDKRCTDYSRFKDVPTKEMHKIVKEKSATIVDVNSQESYKKSHIPGAVHFGSVKGHFAKTLPKNKDSLVVTYCGGKMCTAWQRAAKMACEMGYKNIRHYSEGIKGWNKNNKKG